MSTLKERSISCERDECDRISVRVPSGQLDVQGRSGRSRDVVRIGNGRIVDRRVDANDSDTLSRRGLRENEDDRGDPESEPTEYWLQSI